LADKSLVVADTSGDTERFRLLESMAAYALEKLQRLGQHERMARAHAEYFATTLITPGNRVARVLQSRGASE